MQIRSGCKPTGTILFIVELVNASADIAEIHRLLLRPVRYADPAAQIDKLQPNIAVIGQFDGQFEQHSRRFNKKVGIQLVGSDHRVQSESDGPPDRVPGDNFLRVVGWFNPYLASAGLPMMALPVRCGPGLYRNDIKFWHSHVFRQKREGESASSRLRTAPSSFALAYSQAGVLLEVNMICSPVIPTRWQSTSSGRLEQSPPKSFLGQQLEDVRIGGCLDRKIFPKTHHTTKKPAASDAQPARIARSS